MKLYKSKIAVVMYLFVLLIFANACNNKPPANLLVNADAELPPFDSVPQGWNNIKGNWVSLQGDSANHNFGFAHHGNHFFFSGFNTLCILQQDVDVSKYAMQIDNKKQKFILSGYERTLDQGPRSDQGILRLQCLDESKNKAVYSYSSDSMMSIAKWQAVADSFMAPPSTRFIRVQLVDFLNYGVGSDGYFDNLSLVALPAPTYVLTIIIIVAIVIVIGFIVYFRKVRARATTSIRETP